MSAPPRQQPDRISGRVAAGVGAGALLATAFAVWLAGLELREAQRALERERDSSGHNGTNGMITAPRTAPAIPSAPSGDVPIELTQLESTAIGRDLQARQRAALERWGWKDRARGLAEIPIDRAMDLVVEESGR